MIYEPTDREQPRASTLRNPARVRSALQDRGWCEVDVQLSDDLKALMSAVAAVEQDLGVQLRVTQGVNVWYLEVTAGAGVTEASVAGR